MACILGTVGVQGEARAWGSHLHAMDAIPQVVPSKMLGISSNTYTFDVIRSTPCGDARRCMIVSQCMAADICLFVFGA